MELVKKNIHTERIKAKALLQIPLEEDINVQLIISRKFEITNRSS